MTISKFSPQKRTLVVKRDKIYSDGVKFLQDSTPACIYTLFSIDLCHNSITRSHPGYRYRYIGTYYFVVLRLSKYCFKPTQCQGEISPRFGTDFAEIYKRTISISQCSGFSLKRSLHVCVVTSASIRTTVI